MSQNFIYWRFLDFCQFLFNCQWTFKKLCIRLTLIFKKRHEVASSYALKKPKNMHPLALTPEKHHKFFFPEISSMKISFFKSRSHHVPVQNQQ